jgi:hypothetical protein
MSRPSCFEQVHSMIAAQDWQLADAERGARASGGPVFSGVDEFRPSQPLAIAVKIIFRSTKNLTFLYAQLMLIKAIQYTLNQFN